MAGDYVPFDIQIPDEGLLSQGNMDVIRAAYPEIAQAEEEAERNGKPTNGNKGDDNSEKGDGNSALGGSMTIYHCSRNSLSAGLA